MSNPPRSGAESTAVPAQGVIRERHPLKLKLNAWRKRSPLNPYWIELRWLRSAGERLAPHAQGVLLDVGVGERPYGKVFAPFVRRYVGLEYPPMADNLSPEIWNLLERIRGIIDVWGDGHRLPFLSKSVDTVLSVEVLEHVPDPDGFVAEFARVLKPGGTLMLTVPFMAPLHQLPFDFYRYTPQGLEALLGRHGFRIEALESRGNTASAAGVALTHWIMRCVGAKATHHDGSVVLSRWRAPFVLPVLALVQLFFAGIERVTTDKGLCLGYFLRAKLDTSSSNGRKTTSQS